MESFTDHRKIPAPASVDKLVTAGAALTAAFVFGGFLPAIAVGGAILAVNYIRK